jgi:hypothetical protein
MNLGKEVPMTLWIYDDASDRYTRELDFCIKKQTLKHGGIQISLFKSDKSYK